MGEYKFKIGDRIRNLVAYHEYSIEIGDIGTVVQDNDVPFVQWDNNNCQDGRWAQDEDHMELVINESEES